MHSRFELVNPNARLTMFRYVLVAVALALAVPCAVAAELVFAITEGITYYQTDKEIASRFQPLADILARALKRPVHIAVVAAYADLRAGLTRQEYDLAFVHPAHVALAAVKTGKYRSVAWTAGYTDYAVSLLVNKNEPWTRLEDLRGHTVVSPDPDSITAAGATAAKAVIQSWTQKGGKVLLSSRPVAIKQIIASTKVSADDEQSIHGALLGLAQTDAGRNALALLGYKGFVEPSRDDEQKAIAWLGL